jgi:alcohol dehydrogenase class IV
MVESFTWIDGERLVRFGTGVLGEAPELLARRGFDGYALLTTERAETFGAGLASGAASVAHVPSGSVPDAAAAVRAAVDRRPVVTFGGGRVVDVGKAIAGTFGLPCAAVPTTLAGSPMTPFHRMPAGTTGGALIRPSLVVWDPSLHATLPRGQLVATALNSLAHAFESLYTPLANPVGELAALRAARLLARELPRAEPDREAVALGSLLGGYAIGMSGLAVHHALCQTVVRRAELPHAETNALVLPHTAAFMADRAPVAVGRFARALDAAGDGEPSHASASVGRLAAETGLSGLAELGLDRDAIAELAQATTQHPALGNTPGGAPSQDDLAAILHAAL